MAIVKARVWGAQRSLKVAMRFPEIVQKSCIGKDSGKADWAFKGPRGLPVAEKLCGLPTNV
jgi:hypothetical protein